MLNVEQFNAVMERVTETATEAWRQHETRRLMVDEALDLIKLMDAMAVMTGAEREYAREGIREQLAKLADDLTRWRAGRDIAATETIRNATASMVAMAAWIQHANAYLLSLTDPRKD